MKRIRQYEEDKENILVDEPQQKKNKANLTPIKRSSRVPLNPLRNLKNVLSVSSQRHIRRLGGVVPSKVVPNPYEKCLYVRPLPLQQFSDVRWPMNASYKSDQFAFRGIKFCRESTVEIDKYEFLRANADAMIIAVGEELLVTKQRPNEQVDHSDFDVWIVDRHGQEGPYNLTMILASMELDQSKN